MKNLFLTLVTGGGKWCLGYQGLKKIFNARESNRALVVIKHLKIPGWLLTGMSVAICNSNKWNSKLNFNFSLDDDLAQLMIVDTDYNDITFYFGDDVNAENVGRVEFYLADFLDFLKNGLRTHLENIWVFNPANMDILAGYQTLLFNAVSEYKRDIYRACKNKKITNGYLWVVPLDEDPYGAESVDPVKKLSINDETLSLLAFFLGCEKVFELYKIYNPNRTHHQALAVKKSIDGMLAYCSYLPMFIIPEIPVEIQQFLALFPEEEDLEEYDFDEDESEPLVLGGEDSGD